MWVMLSKHSSLGLINVWHFGRRDGVVKRCVLQPFRFVCCFGDEVSFCYGARTSGRAPGGRHRASPIHRRRALAASFLILLVAYFLLSRTASAKLPEQ